MGRPAAGKIHYDATLQYDLDRKFITRGRDQAEYQGVLGELNGKNVIYTMDIRQVTRFEKQKSNP